MADLDTLLNDHRYQEYTMIRLALAATFAVIAVPALAHDTAKAPKPTSTAKADCAVRFVHMPVTRTGHQPAVMECKRAGSLETASRQPTPQERQRVGMD